MISTKTQQNSFRLPRKQIFHPIVQPKRFFVKKGTSRDSVNLLWVNQKNKKYGENHHNCIS